MIEKWHPGKVPSGHHSDSARLILEERARQLSGIAEKITDDEEMLEVHAFHLGTEYLGLPIGMVREIQPLRAHRWSRVPCAPPFIVGIVNLRGRIYSIMDLAVFWGLPSRPISENTHILLVGGFNRSDDQEIELTLLADDCAEARLIRLNELSPPSLTVSEKMQGNLRGVTSDMMLVVDLESLLSDPAIIVSASD